MVFKALLKQSFHSLSYKFRMSILALIFILCSVCLVPGRGILDCRPLYLTKFIKNCTASFGRELSRVDPGLVLGHHSFSGFITVKKVFNSNLFYWYFPHNNVATAPWIVWLSGGPGVSSLIAMFDQIGPVKFEDGKVQNRTVTWASNYSLLFIDNPVGAGFSFTDDDQGYTTNVEQVSEQLYEFLRQFLEVYPEQRDAPLFIAGSSYAGKYVPAIAVKIHRNNYIQKPIQLKGIILGNAMIDPRNMMHYTDVVKEMGLLDGDQLLELNRFELSMIQLIDDGKMVEAANKFNETIEYIKNNTGVSIYNFLETPSHIHSSSEEFVTQPHVRCAIHVGNASFDLNNQLVYNKMLPDIANSTRPFVEELLTSSYGVLMYSGELDLILPYSNAKRVYNIMKWPRRYDYLKATRTRVQLHPNSSVVAYKKAGGNFIEIMIRGCGHMAPKEQPEVVKYITDSFVNTYSFLDVQGAKEPHSEPLYLTPMIKSGNFSEARELSIVSSELLLGIHSHSGFIAVNEAYQSNLFFWYFPHKDSMPTPWIIWLNGGPGTSSMVGLFDMIGPVNIEDGTLKRRNQTWALDYSLLFIDNPVGTGFSFTRDERGYTSSVDEVAKQLYKFLVQFLEVFPELKDMPLFIAGESYAGKYVPALAWQIHRNNDMRRPIKLKGILLGNPMIELRSMMYYSELVKELGLLQDEHLVDLRALESSTVQLIEDGSMVEAANKYNETIEYIKKKTGVSIYNFLKDPPVSGSRFQEFIMRPEVRRLIHVGNTNFNLDNKLVYQKMLPDIPNSTKLIIEELLESYGVMCYHGQLDLFMPYGLATRVYNQLRWKARDEFLRAPRRRLRHYPDDKLVAYKKAGGNFVEVLIRGCGHMVAEEEPDVAKFILDMFVGMFKK